MRHLKYIIIPIIIGLACFAFFVMRQSHQKDMVDSYNTSERYFYGNGVSQDYTKAVDAYEKAANQGYAPAQWALGNIYKKGDGVPINYSKSVEYYQKAANQNDAQALWALRSMYQNGLGVEKNTTKATEYYQKSADQGDATAQYNLATLYHKGQDVPQDYVKAVEYYQKSANQGYILAQLKLAIIYQTNVDDKKAEIWFKKSVEQCQKIMKYNSTDVLANLGLAYAYGHGVTKDTNKSIELFNKTIPLLQKKADQGDLNAQDNLYIIYISDPENIQDKRKAQQILEKDISKKTVFHIQDLAYSYGEGAGTEKDLEKAKKYYQMACQRNLLEACYRYKNLSR